MEFLEKREGEGRFRIRCSSRKHAGFHQLFHFIESVLGIVVTPAELNSSRVDAVRMGDIHESGGEAIGHRAEIPVMAQRDGERVASKL